MKMNKQAALEQMTRLEAEMARLRAIVEAPDRESLIQLDGETIYVLYRDGCTGTFSYMGFPNFDGIKDAAFENPEQADAYGKAFVTLVKLRHQPGSVTSLQDNTDKEMWVIEPRINNDRGMTVDIDWFCCPNRLTSLISPTFVSRQDAEQAIANVGKAALVHMFETFHHIK